MLPKGEGEREVKGLRGSYLPEVDGSVPEDGEETEEVSRRGLPSRVIFLCMQEGQWRHCLFPLTHSALRAWTWRWEKPNRMAMVEVRL